MTWYERDAEETVQLHRFSTKKADKKSMPLFTPEHDTYGALFCFVTDGLESGHQVGEDLAERLEKWQFQTSHPLGIVLNWDPCRFSSEQTQPPCGNYYIHTHMMEVWLDNYGSTCRLQDFYPVCDC